MTHDWQNIIFRGASSAGVTDEAAATAVAKTVDAADSAAQTLQEVVTDEQ